MYSLRASGLKEAFVPLKILPQVSKKHLLLDLNIVTDNLLDRQSVVVMETVQAWLFVVWEGADVHATPSCGVSEISCNYQTNWGRWVSEGIRDLNECISVKIDPVANGVMSGYVFAGSVAHFPSLANVL